MRLTPLRSLGLGMTAGALLIAVLVVVFAHKDFAQNPSFAGTPITPPKLATDAILDDTNGTPQHIVEPGYATTFVFFGYTRCPDECPLALASLGRAYRDLSDAARARTRIVFVTVDPAHDTPHVLARYAGHFDPHIVALTGTRTALAKVWSAYGVEVQPQGKDLIGHGDSIYAIDATGHIVLVYPPDAPAADLTHDAKTLAS